MNMFDSTDIDFILAQLRLPGNDPRNTLNGTALDPRGIRDVQGAGNNLQNPSWGNADTIFPRVTQAQWTHAQGSFTFGQQGPVFTMTPVSYAIRDINLVDSSPRLISNLVSNQSAEALAAVGYTTPEAQRLAVLDDPTTTAGGRVSPLTGADNPLPYSGFMTLFGQFFDHGLDLVQKGKDGLIMVPLLPGDPLYNHPDNAIRVGGQVVGYNNFILASRTNTVHVDISRSSTDSLVAGLGLAEDRYTAGDAGFSVGRITASAPIGNIANGGVLILNNRPIEIAAGATSADVVNAINAKSAYTGVTASVDGTGTLILDYLANESINTTSSFIDLSQSYGSLPSQTAFVREYAISGVDGSVVITGRLASGADINSDGVGDGMATWADIKANALITGVVLHDKDVLDIPEVRLNADGSVFIGTGAEAGMWLVARDQVTGQVYYVKDSLVGANLSALRLESNGTTTEISGADLDAVRANLLLQGVGHAFLDDMAHGLMTSLNIATGDLSMPEAAALLDAHFISGDGRTNENIGLTSIHDVFHAEHNRVLSDIKVLVNGGIDSDGVAHTARADAATWSGEDFFQAAKLATEMQYQHLVFGEFVRKFSPNVNAFAAYDVTLNPAVTAEFAHAVYRFGHSMLTETVDMEGFDAATGLANGTDNSMGLIEAFLNPLAYNDSTAGEIAIGMSGQVGNLIDEWVTDALRNNLVGLPLDLATLNIVRGRDSGIGSLNQVRADLYDQTGMASLKPYGSWDEFSLNLLHAESLENFIMAYARDAILEQFGSERSIQDWNALRGSDPTLYGTELRAVALEAINSASFMSSNTGLDSVDLWLGGLAEAKVPGGMLGSTFDFIFANQMVELQNADRFYYLNRLAGTNLLANIEAQLFSDIVMRNTGVKHLYSDIFTVPDATVEISAFDPVNAVGSVTALTRQTTQVTDAEGVLRNISSAGWVKDAAGNLTFYGNSGEYLDARGVYSPNNNATLKGNASEVIGGTDAAERINAMGGNDTVWADGGNDTIEGGKGSDFLHGGDGDDVITDVEGNEFVHGDAGNDSINAGSGIDQVFGDDGNDTLRGGLGADVVDGMNDDDLIYGDNGAISQVVFNGVTIDVMDRTGDADVIAGGAGNDTLYGGGGDDGLDGAEGDDVLYGGLGNDGMLGGFGNDRFVMDASDTGFGNTINGDLDVDTIDYSLSVGGGVVGNGPRMGVAVDFNPIVPVVLPVPGPPAPDAIADVENLIGSAFNDSLRTGGNVALGVGLINDQFGAPINFGTELAPVFRTYSVSVDGGAGDDTIEGGDGQGRWLADVNGVYNYVAGADTINGGAGADTVSYASASSTAGTAGVTGVTVNLATTVSQDTVNAGPDVLVSIENIIGSAFDDTLTGNTGANAMSGGAGNDTINGDAGNDTIDGGTGDDVLNGGAGTNTLSYVSLTLAGATVSLAVGTQQNTGGGGLDTFSNFSNLIGSALADTLTGSAAANLLEGGAGNDSLVGGGGNDTLDGGLGNDTLDGGTGTDFVTWANATTALTANLATGLVSTLGGTDRIVNVENLIGTAFADTLTGDANANLLDGGAGNDTLSGASGNDSLIGGAGNDSLDGGVGNDTLNGSAGNDTMNGGAGNDTYVVDAVGDLIVDSAGTDIVNTALHGYVLAAGIENLTIIAAAGLAAANAGIWVTGNVIANTVTGDIGNDTIEGAGGNDSLVGGAGDDRLLGGDGNDSITGGAGADTMTGGAGSDRFVHSAVPGESLTATRDVITDFVRGQDRIDLSALDANTGSGGNQAFTFRGTGAFNNAAQVRMTYDAVNNLTVITGTTNTNTSTLELEIALQGNFTTGVNTLTSTDFIL